MVGQVSITNGTTSTQQNRQDRMEVDGDHQDNSDKTANTLLEHIEAQQTTEEKLLASSTLLDKFRDSNSSDSMRDPESVGDPAKLPPINQRHPLAVAAAFLSGDIQGQHIDFPPGSSMSNIFKNGEGAKAFEKFVLQKFNGRLPGGKVTDYSYTFTWPRAVQTANPAEQVIGSWNNGTAHIDNNGTIHFSVENTMSYNSLFFGRQLSEFGYSGIGSSASDTTMTIRWSSP
jgi:FKBP-type peptidyl-prolyl cis-trans isomerase